MKRKAATKGAKATKRQAKDANATDVLTIVASTDTYPMLDEDAILAKLVHPMTTDDFMTTHFRQKALAVHALPARFDQLVASGLCNLDVKALLEVTSSDEYQAWVQTTDKKIEPVKVGTVEQALVLHRAGHSLYMRSSEALSALLIPALAKELGMGFTTTSLFGELNGEIEIFCGKAGHTTDWHFDSMENFTLQLAGSQTWKLQKGTVPHPVRGCTSHYKTQDAVEQELKLHRMTDPTFAPLDDADDYVSVTLRPGSMLYVPGGMWHRVECADDEDSISMSLSMFSTPYADVVADAVRQLLLQTSAGRAGVNYASIEDAHAQLATVLETLRTQLQSIKPADICPPRLLVHDHDHDHDHDHADEDESDDEDDDSASTVLDACDAQLVEDPSVTIAASARFRLNPLANLLAYRDVPSIHARMDHDVDRLYVLNVGYGHGSYASSLRVEFVVSESQVDALRTLRSKATGAQFTLRDIARPPTRDVEVLVHFLAHVGFLTRLDEVEVQPLHCMANAKEKGFKQGRCRVCKARGSAQAGGREHQTYSYCPKCTEDNQGKTFYLCKDVHFSDEPIAGRQYSCHDLWHYVWKFQVPT
ncbi:hypothetical protein SPRG_16819 [Saprolegnia parasitica CBS 223.65]|uniref:JmjC domain-containing protein n=1 Tax=Saprolegnia parasitica (strain CBS 223.65) TaxID=695850 RepID=A0A067BM28_SAPPC|nr:hypothetical protein SPRG_16819 [Saprolegnia parasitica CBS 223.65]KDO17785.1 hypothetical protein SPRG_16819 [Saprolegnia parasitica CBS 223.65]|eukprot:XP_012211511.1 hypothetical protein SPRG_16819 [Saprolegnia parasitica CBS 223.65]